MQATGNFSKMADKSRIVNVTSAFDTMDTMSIGDVLGKNPKKKAQKAMDATADPA